MYTLQQYIAPVLPDILLAALGIGIAAVGLWEEFKEYRRRSAMALATSEAASGNTADAAPAHGAKAEGTSNKSAHMTRQPVEAARCKSGVC